MESRLKNINNFWAYLLVEELVKNHSTHFFISPGSRSTPLTIAAAENKRVEKIVCFDERGAAFSALGYSRASGSPAVLICTSGTAAANYYPAIVEARQTHIPMIILSADRPPELQDCGANQTINQSKLYQGYPVWYFDMPCPDLSILAEMVLTTIDQAVYRASHPVPGPVHLNIMFREPLEPTSKKFPAAYRQTLRKWEKSELPYTAYRKNLLIPEESEIKQLAHLLNKARRGILVTGQLPDRAAGSAITALAKNLHWPVFADITSGIRQVSPDLSLIRYYDQLLLSEKIKKEMIPAVILHFGRPLTSKRYLQFIGQFPPEDYIHISQEPGRQDPAHRVTQRFQANLTAFCRILSTKVNGQTDKKWHFRISEFDNIIDGLLTDSIDPGAPVSEPGLPVIISRHLKAGHGLYLASSMPIRDFDMYAASTPDSSAIAANRGASGIDGTLASAFGFSIGLAKPVTLVIGDLALLHDLNSLSLLATTRQVLTVIVVNNHGGGIFSFLPVSNFPHVFEKYFGTAHRFDFKHAAAMFGLAYFQPQTNKEFINVYKKSLAGKRSTLIEIQTERGENFSLHRDFQKKIKSAIENSK